LIHGTLRLLTTPACAAAGAAIRASWTHILVDEFQDTSAVQFDMLRALAGAPGRITVVGDADQCIYGFSGSCAGNVASFRAVYLGAVTVRLEHNFRSSGAIVAAASALIGRQPGREVVSAPLAVRGRGAPLRIVECRNGAAEAALVCDALLAMPRGGAGGPSGSQFALSGVAVLYRCGATGATFAAALRQRGIPFNAHGVAFYRRKARDAAATRCVQCAVLICALCADVARVHVCAFRSRCVLRWRC
jgi:DNA helicase-2/ATP-dependent DNA helicase PcrA